MKHIVNELIFKSKIELIADSKEFETVLLLSGISRKIAITAEGGYDTETDKVYLRPAVHTALGMRTLFHEFAHATAYHGRIDRNDLSYSDEEVVAETTSLLLMEYFELSTSETIAKSEAYIATYGKNLRPDYMNALENLALQAKNYILNNWLPDSAAAVKEAA